MHQAMIWALFDELHKIAQAPVPEGLLPEQVQMIPRENISDRYTMAPEPPEPAIPSQGKLQKTITIGKRLGKASLNILDKLTREPEAPYRRTTGLPQTML